MSLIQPYMVQDFRLWMQDLWNKLKGTQAQVNSQIQVVGATLQNNTPGGGQISWSACTVYYNGTAYPIAAGNSGTNALVWWVVGNATFISGASFTPGPTLFPIFTNVAGVADVTWSKVGAGSVQAAQLVGGGLLVGYQPQVASFTISGTVTNATVLSYTGAGALLTLFYQTAGGYATGNGGTTITITLDGQAQTYNLTTNGTPDTYNNQPFANLLNGDGTTNALMSLGFYLTFTTSITITVNTPGGYAGPGTLLLRAGWAKKL